MNSLFFPRAPGASSAESERGRPVRIFPARAWGFCLQIESSDGEGTSSEVDKIATGFRSIAHQSLLARMSMTVQERMGQLLSFKKSWGFLAGCGLLLVACSDNRGRLVDKTPSAPESTPPPIAAQNAPGQPAGHPPIGGQGMADLMAGGKVIQPPSSSSEPAVSGDRAKAALLEFTIDPSWILEKPQSSMRAAQFRLPAPEGVSGDGELALFQGIGGTAEANIQRWIDQFSERSREPIIKRRQTGDLNFATLDREFNVQMLDISGTYTVSTMMGGGTPKTGFRMLAAVVDGVDGGPWHFKLTGPEKTMEYWKPAFLALIDSLKLAK